MPFPPSASSAPTGAAAGLAPEPALWRIFWANMQQAVRLGFIRPSALELQAFRGRAWQAWCDPKTVAPGSSKVPEEVQRFEKMCQLARDTFAESALLKCFTPGASSAIGVGSTNQVVYVATVMLLGYFADKSRGMGAKIVAKGRPKNGPLTPAFGTHWEDAIGWLQGHCKNAFGDKKHEQGIRQWCDEFNAAFGYQAPAAAGAGPSSVALEVRELFNKDVWTSPAVDLANCENLNGRTHGQTWRNRLGLVHLPPRWSAAPQGLGAGLLRLVFGVPVDPLPASIQSRGDLDRAPTLQGPWLARTTVTDNGNERYMQRHDGDPVGLNPSAAQLAAVGMTRNMDAASGFEAAEPELMLVSSKGTDSKLYFQSATWLQGPVADTLRDANCDQQFADLAEQLAS